MVNLLSRTDLIYGSEQPSWGTPSSAVEFPIMGVGTPAYNAALALHLRLMRFMPRHTYADGYSPTVFSDAIDGMLRVAEHVIIKFLPGSSTSPEYCLNDGTLLPAYKQFFQTANPIGGTVRVRFWESTNEADWICTPGDAAAGTWTAAHWINTIVPLRAWVEANYPGEQFIWTGPAMTNFGSAADWVAQGNHYYDVPTLAFHNALRIGYDAAAPADKHLYLPDVYTIHCYGSDAGTDPATILAFYGHLFDEVAADIATVWAGTPGATMKLGVSEWARGFGASWTVAATLLDSTVAAYYTDFLTLCATKHIYLANAFTLNGDPTATPDLVNADGTTNPWATAFKALSGPGAAQKLAVPLVMTLLHDGRNSMTPVHPGVFMPALVDDGKNELTLVDA